MALILTVNAYPFLDIVPVTPYRITGTLAAGSSMYGIVAAIPSLSSDSTKQAAVDKVGEAGFGWVRYEFTYADSVDFAPYDAANAKIKAAGLKTLGLLAYPGSGKSHDQWKAFVTSVVGHYGTDIAAWEVMNEIDNSLSASDYVSYLSEARDIIKGINASAKIVLSGLTSRIEATAYWDGVAAAGGWGLFDSIGLHVYHNGNPEKVNFGGGDVVGELDRVVGNINKNGGGKTIWITELGYQSGSVGEQNQANWLARTLIMLKSVSKIERIFPYKLIDGSGDSFGLLTSSLGEKAAFSSIKSTVGSLSGLSTGTKLTPQTKTTLDSLESVSKWDTTPTSNGTTTLSSVAGYSGNGMKLDYQFSDSSAYAIAEKNIPISGTPSAIAAWMYGDDTKNVWKFRFKDANGETFQTDLGSISAGWSYKQFSIGTDTAFTSWGGDGKIDFPISFNAIVLDRQGGAVSGSGIIDEIIAISGSADLYAYQFGGTVGWWKAAGTDTATLCNASREFREDPQFASNVNCNDTPVAASSSSSSTSTAKTKKSAAPKPPAAPAPAPPAPVAPKATVDKTKSYIRLDGQNVVADGTASYRLVVGVKDSSGAFLTDRKPTITLKGEGATAHDSVLIGPEWIGDIVSTKQGAVTAAISADGVDLGSLVMTFISAAPAVVITPAPSAAPTAAPAIVPVPAPSPSPMAGGISAIAILLIIVGSVIRRRLLVAAMH